MSTLETTSEMAVLHKKNEGSRQLGTNIYVYM